MLDQLSAFKDGEFSINDVYKLNGVISYDEFKLLMEYISEGKLVSIINFIEDIDKNGKSLDRFIQDFVLFLKDLLVYKNTNALFSNIKDKNVCIEYLSGVYKETEIYELIILMNDLSIRIKNSSFTKIMLIIEFIRFSNKLNSEDNVLVNAIDTLKEKEKSVEINNDATNTVSLLKSNITDRQKKIRINNTFATANKKYKNEFLTKWPDVIDKLSNDLKYVSIAGMMTDVDVLVVGEKNIMFLAKYDSLLERLFLNLDLIEELLFSVFNVYYKVVFLLGDEWEYEKNKYVLSLQDSKKYVYIDENESSLEKDYSNNDNDVEKLLSIFGNDIIKYQ